MRQIRNYWSWLITNAPAIGVLATIIGGTWGITTLTFQSEINTTKAQLDVYKAQVDFYKSTEKVDIPKLLEDFSKFVGSANATLELKKLQNEHAKLKEEYNKINTLYSALKTTIKLEEEFTLKAGQSRNALNGNVLVAVQDISPSYVSAKFNGKDTSDYNLGVYWDVGEFVEVELGGVQYRLTLSEILQTQPSTARFKVEKLPKKIG